MKKFKLFIYFIFAFILSFPSFAIIGGEDAVPGEFAWHSKISSDAHGLCGGSLIHKQWVLTAAHCLVSDDGNLTKIENISVSFPNDIFDKDNYKVKKIVIHPDYLNHIKIKNKGLSSYGSAIDDIALIQMEQPIKNITPVKIQASSINEGAVLSVIGLGINRIDNDQGLRPDKLQKITLPVISYNQCMDIIHTPVAEETGNADATEQPGTLISKDMLCLSARAKGLCLGDSGGAVVHHTKGLDGNPLTILKGVSAKASDGCPFPGSPFEERPGIVVNVDEYIDFIEYAVRNGEAPKVTNLVKNSYNNEPAFAYWEISNNHNGYYYDGISFGDWSDGFFGTSHLLSQRRQVIDVLAATGQTQEGLDNTVKKIEVFEFFAKTYCGGDQYGMEVTLYDKNWLRLANQKTGTKTLKGSCQWHNDIWYQEKFVFDYPKGLRFIIFSDFGKDSEQWQGYYGPKMTFATVRLKTDKQSPQFPALVETDRH